MTDTYEIGSTQGTLLALGSFTVPIPEPLSTFKPYSRVVINGAGGEVGLGYPVNTWDFGYLDDDQRNQLRALCTGASATVYIKTYNDSLATPAWQEWRAIMVWMHEGEERRNDKRLKMTLTFKLLEDVTPT